MRAYARKFCSGATEDHAGDDCAEQENLWGIVGLIHDFDYEKYPSREDHPYKRQRHPAGARLARGDSPRHPVSRRI